MSKFTFEDYLGALGGAGPKLARSIVERAAADVGTDGLTAREFKALCAVSCKELTPAQARRAART